MLVRLIKSPDRSESGLYLPAGAKDSHSEALLAEELTAFVPGEDFGGCGKNHIRFSFACSEENINKGMDRLDQFVRSLK